MQIINYAQIYAKLTKGLSLKTKDILDRRFGVKKEASETLESIGNRLGITRERVRQIEEVGFNFIRKNNKELLGSLFANLRAYFESHGGFKREEIAIEELGGRKYKPYIQFLLTMGNDFSRICEKKDYHNFWTFGQNNQNQVKENLHGLVLDIKNHGKLLTREELETAIAPKYSMTSQALSSYLEISKKIQSTQDGKLGLIDWPEIKPRGVKDKAYLVFKKHNKPLHFREITKLIDEAGLAGQDKKTHPQTVHNELIKDPRFVLVGRGMYALSEWGYVPGTIKDIITKVIKEKPQLVSQEEIVKEVLSQRLVARNTVMINLNNKKYFQKDAQGKYFIRETQTA